MAADSSSKIQSFDDFVKVHSFLLAAAGIPSSLYENLFRKLSSETFDGGDFFSVEPCEGGRQRRLVLSAESLKEESDVFLIDHAWTFRLQDALKQVRVLDDSRLPSFEISDYFSLWV